MTGWTVPPVDLILGDPNGAHIELLAADAKIVLYNENNVPIMEFDGTTTFGGSTFSRILIRNNEGDTKLQADPFQAAYIGNHGGRIRMVPGEIFGQYPRLEIEPVPFAAGRLNPGELRGESDEPSNGAALILESPTAPGIASYVAAVLRLDSENDSAAPLATVDADLSVTGAASVTGTATVAGLSVTGAATVADLSVTGPAAFAGGKLLTASERAAVTTAYSPTTATPTALVGTTITVNTTRAGATWEADWTADVDLTTAGAVTVVVLVEVDGVQQPPLAVWNPANVVAGARDDSSQGWGGTLGAAGAHTFRLLGYRSSGAGVARINIQHTTLRVRVYE